MIQYQPIAAKPFGFLFFKLIFVLLQSFEDVCINKRQIGGEDDLICDIDGFVSDPEEDPEDDDDGEEVAPAQEPEPTRLKLY